MNRDLPASTPLHQTAVERFASRTVRGFRTFAPPSEPALVELAGSADGLLVAVNAEKFARADARLKDIANRNLAYPDGMGAVLALRRLGVKAPRIAGADLWKGIVATYAGKRRFYLMGAAPEVINQVATRLREQHPGLDLRQRDGYLQPGDVERLYDEFASFRPEIVLVGMGSPRQEILMDKLFAAHPALYMGLGGSFDVFVGRKPRAPRAVQAIGLEWAYQFVREPRRLRRLPAYLKFGALLALGRIR